MEPADQRCKLCVKHIQSDGLISDQNILKKLGFLQINLDQSVEKSNSLCKQCEEKITDTFKFKSCLVNSFESHGSEGNQANISSKTSAEKAKCHLCKNSVDKLPVILLTKFLRNGTMMEVFQGHIQEIDLTNLKQSSIICEMCQKSLAIFSTLVTLWSIASDWNEEETKDDMDDFKMIEVKKEDLNVDEFSDSIMNSSCAFNASDSNSASTASTIKNGNGKRGQSTSDAGGNTNKKIKTEIDEITDSNESVFMNNKGVKKEDEAVEETKELQIKNEELDIKDEYGLSANSVDYGDVLEQKPCGNKNDMKFLDSEDCLGAIKCQTFGEQVLVHSTSKKLQIYKCKTPDNETQHKRKSLNEAQLLRLNKYQFSTNHKRVLNVLKDSVNDSGNEKQIYPCNKYPYETTNEWALTDNSSENIHVDKCNECSYVIKRKHGLQSRLLKHKILDVRVYKCNECSYETIRKPYLQRHLLKHKNLDVQVYKCNECSYETIRKPNFKRHLLKHKNLEDVQVYRCNECSYATKYKHNLQHHWLNHKSLEDVQVYRCNECSFVTKYKNGLQSHVLKHKTLDVQVYKCNECSYETIRKPYLQRHLLKHKNLEDVQVYKCNECSYATKYKHNLQYHLLNHKSLEDVQMYRCNECWYVTKHKRCLRSHLEKHKNKMFM